MAETFVFIKFRNSILTNTQFGHQRIVILLEKKHVVMTDGKLEIKEVENMNEEFFIVLREIELINAAFD